LDQGKLQICTPSPIKGQQRRECRVFDLLVDTGQPDVQTAFLMGLDSSCPLARAYGQHPTLSNVGFWRSSHSFFAMNY
jgi:hypothetical protein